MKEVFLPWIEQLGYPVISLTKSATGYTATQVLEGVNMFQVAASTENGFY